MVRQSLKDIDVKKIKMAKDVLAVFEVLGVDEDLIDEIISLVNRVNELEKEVSELTEFKDSVLRTQKNEASGGTESKEKLSDIIQKNFDGKVEEFNPYGKH